MKVTCIVDNIVYSHLPFWGEQGLAFLIETRDGRVLFDTGWSGSVLMHNMDLLGLAPETIDALAISHAHCDHTGGVPALLDRVQGISLFAHPDLFRERFTLRDGLTKPVGLPLKREALERCLALRLSTEASEILPGVWTTGEITKRPEPEGRADHDLVWAQEGYIPDPYQDDMALVLETGMGLVVLCGCCHAGLLNTLSHVGRTFGRDIFAVVGGTHLASIDKSDLRHTIEILREWAVPWFYPNHCTGLRAYCALANAFGDRVIPCPVGTRLGFQPA
jgi:7,8-dihydropterin-6-yl-methyl-4-(beta-D-ribofuranosyl)aminobenzene 5'-phosphate synthase